MIHVIFSWLLSLISADVIVYEYEFMISDYYMMTGDCKIIFIILKL